MSREQEARLLVCDEAHGVAVADALGTYPSPDSRMVHRSRIEAVARQTGEPVQVFIAWLHRLTTDDSVRPLDADVEFRWPLRPDPDNVALVLWFAVDPRCWYYEVRAALLLAERALDEGPPSSALVDGLLALRARLEDDRLHSSEFFRSKALPRLLQLIARTTPNDVVDLAFVENRDRWAAIVADVVGESRDPARTARALLHLGSPRGGKASKPWWAKTTELLASDPDMVAVAEMLLGAVVTIDVTPRESDHDGWEVPDPFLLAPGNEQLARGLAWALRILPGSADRAELLGRVVLRSAALVWVVPAHRMLCPKLASAAVDTLIAVDSQPALEQLAVIAGEIRSPPLVRRIWPHVGLDADELVAALRKRGPLPRPDR